MSSTPTLSFLARVILMYSHHKSVLAKNNGIHIISVYLRRCYANINLSAFQQLNDILKFFHTLTPFYRG